MAGPDFDATKPVASSAMVSAEMRTNFTALERRLHTNTTPVGNVGAGEDDLMSWSLPAGTLGTNGQGIRIKMWGVTANNANAKTLRAYLGTTALAAPALGVSSAATWSLELLIVRTGATAQEILRFVVHGVSILSTVRLTAAETLANALTIKATGEATADNDIQQYGMVVEFLA